MSSVSSYGFSPGCNNCCCPICVSGSLVCTACPDDTSSIYRARFANWINQICTNCENKNASVDLVYIDNKNAIGVETDCLCHFEGTFDWTENIGDSDPTPTCGDTCTAKVRLYIAYTGPEVTNGPCGWSASLFLDRSCEHQTPPSGYFNVGLWAYGPIAGSIMPCNYFDTEKQFTNNPLSGATLANGFSCDSSKGASPSGFGYDIDCFLRKVA